MRTGPERQRGARRDSEPEGNDDGDSCLQQTV